MGGEEQGPFSVVVIVWIRIVSLQSHKARFENVWMGALPLLSLPGCLSLPAVRVQTSYMFLCKPLACKPLQLLAHQQIQPGRILGCGNFPISTCFFVYLHCKCWLCFTLGIINPNKIHWNHWAISVNSSWPRKFWGFFSVSEATISAWNLATAEDLCSITEKGIK